MWNRDKLLKRAASGKAPAAASKPDKVAAELPVKKIQVAQEHSPPDRGKISLTSKILEVRWCVGCTESAVDAIGSPSEVWWCKRPGPDGEFQWEFKKIKGTIQVGQCPRLKEMQEVKEQQIK